MYGIIIDTDKYAGNFEREVCAWVTGHIGDCGVGGELVENKITKQFPNIGQKTDDHGCWRPTEVWPNDEKKYNSLIIYFEKKPTKEQIELIKERCKSFNEINESHKKYRSSHNGPEFLGFKLVEIKTTIDVIEI